LAWKFPPDAGIVAETAAGTFAGYVAGTIDRVAGTIDPAAGGGTSLRIFALEVKAEYRGLGLGKLLLSRLVEKAAENGISRINIDLPQGREDFSRHLLRESFTPYATRYTRP
jgi:ribosomal protein S18 acetylase RimI-like enzyme